jgi:hypothetical protein
MLAVLAVLAKFLRWGEAIAMRNTSRDMKRAMDQYQVRYVGFAEVLPRAVAYFGPKFAEWFRRPSDAGKTLTKIAFPKHMPLRGDARWDFSAPRARMRLSFSVDGTEVAMFVEATNKNCEVKWDAPNELCLALIQNPVEAVFRGLVAEARRLYDQDPLLWK